MKTFLTFALTAAALAQSTDHPTGPRITPPTVMAVAPQGVARGATVEMTVEGFNLAGATAIHFSEPGIKAKILRIKELPDLPDIRLGSNGTPSTIDVGPLPPRNQITVELDIDPAAAVGPVAFRVQTPLGASPEGRFLIEPYYGESPDREPNDTPETAFETYLPTILVGTISRPGDVDYYKITAKAGDQLVFDHSAAALGTALQPVVAIIGANLDPIAEFGAKGERGTAFAHTFAAAGTYYIRIGDYQESGGNGHTYRIKTGQLPLVTSAYPLGVARGQKIDVALTGYNLKKPALAITGQPTPEDESAIVIRPDGAFNKVRLSIGENPEISAAATAEPQPVTAPVTINGKLDRATHTFRFRAKKGEAWVIETMADRVGSPLDTLVEVLDAKGAPIERATIRSVGETATVLRDHASESTGLRLQSPVGLAVGDYLLIGTEIMRIQAMPPGPDDDTRMVNFGGRRIAFLDTTPEAHANDSRVFKVQIHPPGTQFAPNGLPLVRIAHQNDDGGPGYGRDSKLRFTAPADGDYLVKLRDTRGISGPDYAYRLMIQPPRPDFRLSAAPRNPNVPVGGRIPLTVTALRLDEFRGPIEVEVTGLPAGLTATRGVIGEGQDATTILISSAADAKLERSAPLTIVGKSGTLRHEANPDDKLKLITLMPEPDLYMTAETKEVTVVQGGSAEVTVSIKRNHGYGGRVPVQVMNLPPGVRVPDVGLNGVLINEDETRRTFTIEALPTAEPIEQTIIIGGLVETRAGGQQSIYAAEPVKIRVKARTQVSSVR